ncbi:MAG: universal stress protein [Gaiellaceae bacterium]
MSGDVWDIERILVATDGSPSALDAVKVGVDLAQEDGAEVVAIHVASADGRDSPDPLPLDSAVSVARDHGVELETHLAVGDDVVEVISELADQLDADLVVVGSRGLNAALSSLLGSVSRGLAAQCPRPVLVVRSAHAAGG